MYNILTSQDLSVLISLAEINRNEFSPVPSSFIETIVEDEAINSKRALEKIGFIEDGKLSNKGKLIIEALMSPEKVVVTTNAALKYQAAVSYCFKNGFWTALAPDIETQLITVISPIFVEDIKLFAKQNILYDMKIENNGHFSIELSNAEVLALELSQLAIIKRFKNKQEALTKSEALFSLSELFEKDVLYYVAASSDFLDSDQRKELVEIVSEPMKMGVAIAGLVKKGLLETEKIGADIGFRHTSISRKWIMEDGLKDRVVIRSFPSNTSDSYRIMSSGIVNVIPKVGKVQYKSVSDIDFEVFNS